MSAGETPTVIRVVGPTVVGPPPAPGARTEMVVPRRAKVVLPPKLARAGRRPLLPRVLTIEEAALVLRIGHNALRRLLNRGDLGGFRMGTARCGRWLTTDLDLMAFMGFESPGRPSGVLAVRTGFPGTHISATDRWAAHHEKMNRETQATQERTRQEKAAFRRAGGTDPKCSSPVEGV